MGLHILPRDQEGGPSPSIHGCCTHTQPPSATPGSASTAPPHPTTHIHTTHHTPTTACHAYRANLNTHAFPLRLCHTAYTCISPRLRVWFACRTTSRAWAGPPLPQHSLGRCTYCLLTPRLPCMAGPRTPSPPPRFISRRQAPHTNAVPTLVNNMAAFCCRCPSGTFSAEHPTHSRCCSLRKATSYIAFGCREFAAHTTCLLLWTPAGQPPCALVSNIYRLRKEGHSDAPLPSLHNLFGYPLPTITLPCTHAATHAPFPGV